MSHSRQDASDQLFGSEYYKHNLGPVPYERSPEWTQFFGEIARRTLVDFNPATALDVGCAFGILVEALRDLGVDARGFDISEYAIGHVPERLKPYIQLGSILDPNVLTDRHDLVFCIEVVEHLAPEDADKAI